MSVVEVRKRPDGEWEHVVGSPWPFGGRPRSATLVIQRLDGGKIGT